MNDDKFKILLKDYEKTLAFIDKADDFLFRIRNWALVSSSAVIVFSITSKAYWPLLGNILIIVGFMIIELMQKSFHEDCIVKSYKLEEIIQNHFKDEECKLDEYSFGIGHSIKPISAAKIIALFFQRDRSHIRIFYLLLALATAGASLIIWAPIQFEWVN